MLLWYVALNHLTVESWMGYYFWS